ncbi:MAG: hypothetical protein Q9185_001885 [Variospora sp. 1 TL-2023]
MISLRPSDANRLSASRGQEGPSQHEPRASAFESNDSSGAISIEVYLYRIEPFRSSSETTPLPFPYHFTDLAPGRLADLQTRFPQLHNQIRTIVQTHGLLSLGVSATQRLKPGYPGGDPQPMIRINARSPGAHDIQRWHAARQAVQDYLGARQIHDMSVEIVDPEKAMVRSLFPLPPSDFFIQAFEAVSFTIMDTLGQAMGTNWTSYCLFKVGMTAGRASYCVFVTVQPRTVANWQRIQQRLAEIMNTEIGKSRPHLVGLVQAAFAPGGMSLGTGRGQQQPVASPTDDDKERFTGGRSHVQNLDGNPKIGTSIGVIDSAGGGTLGGFFGLKVGATIHRGFLTNHHVVAPDPETGALFENVNRWGIRYTTAVEHPAKTKVQYFAQADVDTTQKNLRFSLNANAEHLQRLEEEIDQRTAMGTEVPANRLAQVRNLRQDTSKIQGLQQAASLFPQVIGHTIVSSGRAMRDQNVPEFIDWAFVSVDDQNLDLRTANKLPDAWELGHDTPDTYIPGVNYTPGNPVTAFSQFDSLVKGNWYFKKGRSTDLSCGLCHGTEVVVNWTSTRSILQSNSELGPPQENKVCKVAIIINGKSNEPSARQRSFSKKGDSGSLVFDSFGAVCGLLFGSYSHDVSEVADWKGNIVEAGCVVSMEDVRQWIGITTTPRNPDLTPKGPPGQLLIP